MYWVENENFGKTECPTKRQVCGGLIKDLGEGCTIVCSSNCEPTKISGTNYHIYGNPSDVIKLDKNKSINKNDTQGKQVICNTIDSRYEIKEIDNKLYCKNIT